MRSWPMTYSSRNFLISCGEGSELRTPRVSKRLSSAMMSLQTSTHSSQMKTVGPAMSLRTSFWSLLQKEQRRTSDSPFFLTMGRLRSSWDGYRPPRIAECRRLRPLADDIVNDTVFLALLGRHDVVPLRILLDTLQRLAGVQREDLVDPLAHAQDLAGRDVDVARLATQAGHPRLMDEDAGVRQRVSLPLGPGRQQHGRNRRRLPDADR